MIQRLVNAFAGSTLANRGPIIDMLDFADPSISVEDDSIEEKIEALADMICRTGDEPAIKSAALFVLMATLENTSYPKELASMAKHLAFTRCGELNLCGMVDVQVGILERELFAENGSAF
jgi:hypothetical protein